MVPAQSFGIARRTLDLEDYVDVARRHAGWIAGPAFFGTVASIVIAFLLPNEYTSEAVMSITPVQISENIVQSTISNSMNERIQQMTQTIESRGALGAIITDPHLLLYKDEQKTLPLDDVIEIMRKHVTIEPITLPGAMNKRASGFKIKFNYSDRLKAQQTVQVLMNRFEELEQSTQKLDQDAVTGYVSDELQKARASLTEANTRLTAFQQANFGKLPDSTQLNLGREAMLTEKIRSDTEQIYRDESSITALETQRAQAKGRLDIFEETEAEMAATGIPGSPEAKQNQELAELDKNIDNQKFQLEDLKRRYSASYPDVKNLESTLASFEARRDRLAGEIRKAEAEAESAKSKEAAKKAPSVRERELRQDVNDQIARIESAEKSYRLDIDRLTTEKDNYKKESDQLNQTLKDSTGLQAPYQELLQARTLADDYYNDLVRKQQLAQANSQLIQRKAGENLEVLDVPSLPQQPTSPERPKIIGAGFALSILLGFCAAGVREAKDTSLKNLKDVRAYTNLPVLCSIPLLENTMLVKRKRRLAYLAWSAGVILGAAAVGGAVFYYTTVTMRG
jgi:uncharacterized protein involved in exopolysaccharide biosynthesis